MQRYKNYVENLQQPKKRYEPEDYGPEESEESDNYITEIRKQKGKPVKKQKFYEEVVGASENESLPSEEEDEEEEKSEEEVKKFKPKAKLLTKDKSPNKVKKGITVSIKI